MSSHPAIDELAQGMTDEVKEEILRFIEKEGINAEIQSDAAEMARIAARNILEPDQPPLKDFPKLPLDINETTEEDIRYMLIQEFLQSAGFKFTSSVLKYEGQCPEFHVDREELGNALGLPAYDKKPFLVHIIEQKLKNEE